MLDTTINCPHCNKHIEIDKAFKNQWSSQVNAAYKEQYQEKDLELKTTEEALAARELAVKIDENKIQNQIDAAVAQQVKLISPDIQKAAEAPFAEQLAQAAEDTIELNKLKAAKIRSDQEKITEDSKVELKIESEKAALAEKMKADFEQMLEQQNAANKADLEQKLEQQNAANEVKINQVKNSLNNANRQVNQGSMQIQGEALEVCVENFLTGTFPLDTIEPIKPGAKGADCLQHVSDDGRNIYGTIYLEIKKTKDFKQPWIKKFKADIREKNADFGVLITETMPKGATKPQRMEGIWVCSVDDYEMVIQFIRHLIVELNRVKVVNENAFDKQTLVYNFITSKEFARTMDLFFDIYQAEVKALEHEEKLMSTSWGKRRKNLETMKKSTASLIGAFQSYSGDSISEIKSLEISAA